MNQVIKFPGRPCRHIKSGRCSNLFWKTMQDKGKPGLAEYSCVLWADKLKKIDLYWDIVGRLDRFGLSNDKDQNIFERSLDKIDSVEATCPDFKPRSETTQGSFSYNYSKTAEGACLYYYLETCLLKFPVCEERCIDYVPEGVQGGSPKD